ncbi:MAG: hypothetical protein SGJ21_15790 [Alphaproteobacteria bacterium]|nr:hypothetical protein [Alphaproteobacteria bacterium]MDZ4762525.1 hypothetical protein [Alphaproteobacteria bacterium]
MEFAAWTNAEDEQLRQLSRANGTVNSAAARIGRTVDDVSERADSLGVTLSPSLVPALRYLTAEQDN